MEPFGSKAGAGVGNQTLEALCAVKFQKWKNALEPFVDHESTKYHRNSVSTAETITTVLSGKQDSIAIQLDHQRKTQILENRRRIIPIIKQLPFVVDRESLCEDIERAVHLGLNQRMISTTEILVLCFDIEGNMMNSSNRIMLLPDAILSTSAQEYQNSAVHQNSYFDALSTLVAVNSGM